MNTSKSLRAAGMGLIGLVLMTAGCTQTPPPPPVVLVTDDVKPSADCSALDGTLSKAVNSNGVVNPAALKDLAPQLDDQLKLLAVTGPTITPRLFKTNDDRLAYWYNARMAWSLKLWLDAGCPQTIDHASVFQDRIFPLDGRPMSLHQIDDVLAQDGDWRALVAAPSICFQGAALPTKAFSPEGVRAQVADRFNKYVDDPSRLVVDVSKRQVVVPPALWGLRDVLTRSYDESYNTRGATLQTALLPYLQGSSLRRMRDAVGFSAVPMPAEPLRFAVPKK